MMKEEKVNQVQLMMKTKVIIKTGRRGGVQTNKNNNEDELGIVWIFFPVQFCILNANTPQIRRLSR